MREVQTMRKHSARKWLHFVLDLLPILVLPIFAIYEINHDQNEPITVTDGAWEHQPKYQTNDVSNFDDIVIGNIYNIDYVDLAFSDFLNEDDFVSFVVLNVEYYTFDLNHTIFDEFARGSFYLEDIPVKTVFFMYPDDLNILLFYDIEQDYILSVDLESEDTYSFKADILMLDYSVTNNQFIYALNSSTYQEYAYIYNENHVYDNTDIGSQMLYAIYKPVKDYFNFNNVFNFGDIYNWFEVNMFGGNAPMPIFIVWNIIVYQFLMDLMFLVYSIFMFIIDFTSECLERCFSFSRHGGSR